ncbi:ABC transporter permease, partial [Mesorhizobium sp. M7A.F.Ca.CA.004.11.1.1]
MFSSLFVFRGRASPMLEFAVSVAAAVLVVALWELAARAGIIAPQFLPSPSRVVIALWTMLTEQNLLWHVAVSTTRVWIAFLLAAVMAIPIGIMMSSYRIVGAALEPMIDFIRYLPVPALVPLSIIWFGVGEETKIFLLWLGTF